jgi:uncharacterized cupredoxin-like copper-binding protein
MAQAQPDRGMGDRPSTPRWVKALGIGIVVVALLVVIVVLVSGGEHGPGRHAASARPATHSPAASDSLAHGDVGGPVDATHADRKVEVTALDTMAFAPSSVDVSAGEILTFVVTNTGQAVHEFTLGDAAMQQEHADAMAHMPGGMAHDLPNSITLEPGETRELTWQFGQAGELDYACHQPGHYEAGMRGRITVG